MSVSNRNQIIIVGGGIGGLALALALTQKNIRVLLLEQATEIKEIGAGIQLAPNAFAALDALGIGAIAREQAVFTDPCLMLDAVDAKEIVRIETGEAFQKRFGGPYAVIHRADIHLSILEAVQDNPLIQFRTSTQITDIKKTDQGVEVVDQHGNVYSADAVVGCDGVKSVIREKTIGRQHSVTGHVVYRAVIDEADMPADLRLNSPVLWVGPRCHLVHYPLRGGRQYNLVVTFHSREKEVWGVREGSKEEVMSYFSGIHEQPRQLLDKPTSWRRWATADADPVEAWGTGPVTLLGDAAHPMTQYMAQGACMALEDAVTLAEAIAQNNNDMEAGFRQYERVRIPRTARVLWSSREMGRLFHAQGVERLVRNQLWKGHSQERIYTAFEWLYGWKKETCLDE